MRHPLIATLALIPAAALAECPVADDLVTGIRLVDEDATETFARDSDLSVSALYEDGSNPPNQSLLVHGIYVVENMDLDENGTPVPGTRVVYGYPLTAPDIPLPTPGGSWSTTVTRLGDGTLATEQEFYTFGQMTRITIGACSYDALPITARFPDEGENRYDVLNYLPALGFAYLAEYHDAQFDDIYSYTRIEAVK